MRAYAAAAAAALTATGKCSIACETSDCSVPQALLVIRACGLKLLVMRA
jgi:hypothetical protein